MAIEEKKCEECKKSFYGTSKAKYCGPICRHKAFRARKKRK